MDSATKQAFLDNVNGWVFDEHKIVTYAWLSQELSLPANLAKKLLFAFARNNSGVDVRRAVSGTLADGSLSIRVVPQANVEAVKASMSSVHSDHIYSVQAPSADQAEATSAVEAGVGAGAPGAKVQVQVSARKDLSGRIWSVSLAQVRELVASRSSEGTAFRANTASAVRNACIKVRQLRNGVPTIPRASTAPVKQSSLPTATVERSSTKDSGTSIRKAPAKRTTPNSFFSGHSNKKATKKTVPAAASPPKPKKKSRASFFGSQPPKKVSKSQSAGANASSSTAAVAAVPAGTTNDVPAPRTSSSHSQAKQKKKKKAVVEESDDDDDIVDEPGMHAAFDRQRELQPSATVPYEPERNSPSPKPMDADLVLTSDEENEAESDHERSPAKKRKAGSHDEDVVDDEEDGSETPKPKAKKRRKRKKKAGALDSGKASDDDDDEAGISVLGSSPTPAYNPSSRFFDNFKATPSPETKKQGKKKKKLVTKTFMDDEGFMVTEQVWETDDEAPSPDRPSEAASSQAGASKPIPADSMAAKILAKKAEARKKAATSPKTSKKRNPKKVTRKQPNLMSFFGGGKK